MTSYCYYLVLDEDQRETLDAALTRVIDQPHMPRVRAFTSILRMVRKPEPKWRLEASALQERRKAWNAWKTNIFARDIVAVLKTDPSLAVKEDADALETLIEDYDDARGRIIRIENRLDRIAHEIRKLEESGDRDGVSRLRADREWLEGKKNQIKMVALPEIDELWRQMPDAAAARGGAGHDPVGAGDLWMIELDNIQNRDVDAALDGMIEHCDEQLRHEPDARYEAHRRNCRQILGFLSNRSQEICDREGKNMTPEAFKIMDKQVSAEFSLRFIRDSLAQHKTEGSGKDRLRAEFLNGLIEDHEDVFHPLRTVRYRLCAVADERREMEERGEVERAARLKSEQEELEREEKHLEAREIPEYLDLFEVVFASSSSEDKLAELRRADKRFDAYLDRLHDEDSALDGMIEHCDDREWENMTPESLKIMDKEVSAEDSFRFIQKALSRRKTEGSREDRLEADFLNGLIEDHEAVCESLRNVRDRLCAVADERRGIEKRGEVERTARLKSEQEELEREEKRLEAKEIPERLDLFDIVFVSSSSEERLAELRQTDKRFDAYLEGFLNIRGA